MNFINQDLCQKANCVNLRLHHFGYATIDPDWNGHIQNPVLSRLYYIISGKAHITSGNINLDLLPGNWYLLPAGFSFDFGCPHKMEHIYFHISLSGDDGLDALASLLHPLSIADDTNPYPVFNAYSRSDRLTDALVIKEKIYNILLKLIEKSPTKPEIHEFSQCIQKAVEYINLHLGEKISLAEIAQYAYVSKSTLSSRFKTELKMTVLEYIQWKKMFKAEQLLKNSDLSVLEISKALGFSEQFYFTRYFKQFFGIPPREYRKRNIH